MFEILLHGWRISDIINFLMQNKQTTSLAPYKEGQLNIQMISKTNENYNVMLLQYSKKAVTSSSNTGNGILCPKPALTKISISSTERLASIKA